MSKDTYNVTALNNNELRAVEKTNNAKLAKKEILAIQKSVRAMLQAGVDDSRVLPSALTLLKSAIEHANEFKSSVVINNTINLFGQMTANSYAVVNADRGLSGKRALVATSGLVEYLSRIVELTTSLTQTRLGGFVFDSDKESIIDFDSAKVVAAWDMLEVKTLCYFGQITVSLHGFFTQYGLSDVEYAIDDITEGFVSFKDKSSVMVLLPFELSQVTVRVRLIHAVKTGAKIVTVDAKIASVKTAELIDKRHNAGNLSLAQQNERRDSIERQKNMAAKAEIDRIQAERDKDIKQEEQVIIDDKARVESARIALELKYGVRRSSARRYDDKEQKTA